MRLALALVLVAGCAASPLDEEPVDLAPVDGPRGCPGCLYDEPEESFMVPAWPDLGAPDAGL